LPDWYFSRYVASRSWFWLPAAMIGELAVPGLAKIFRNVLNCRSGVSFGEFSESSVVGTLRSPLDRVTSAFVSVDRNFTSAQAASRCLLVFGMPITLPVT
jgi:hypothetical protein